MKFSDLAPDARTIVSEIFYLTIATTNTNGTPWVSPVYFNFDDQCNLFWISNKEAIHSKNIAETNEASISIFNSTLPVWEGQGVYLQCSAIELHDDEEILRGIEKYYCGRHVPHPMDRKSISDYVGTSPWRMYRAMPYQIELLGNGKLIDGYHIDERISAESD